MLRFLRKTPRESIFRFIRVDMHSHLLPGIDDGSTSLATSVELIKGMEALGFEKLITTPHVFLDYYPNTTALINEKRNEVAAELVKMNCGIGFESAAEYFVDWHFEQLIDKDDLLYFGNNRYVLIELSFIAPAKNLEAVVFNLKTRGYQPVLAHPERYVYWHQQPEVFQHLKALGCLLQLNFLSLVGYYGINVKRNALKLLKLGTIDFIGTDVHHNGHMDLLTHHQFDSNLGRLFEEYPFINKKL